MAINVLDSRTETVLDTEAARIDFLGQCPRPESIVCTSQTEDASIDALRVIKIDDDRIATVYSVPAAAVTSQLQMADIQSRAAKTNTTQTGSQHDSHSHDVNERTDSGGRLFAAEWGDPVTTGQRSPTFQYQTLLFDSAPDGCDIRLAIEIIDLSYRFEFGDLDTQYICQDCESQVHWTDVPTPSPTPLEVPLHTRASLVDDHRCGCQDSSDSAGTIHAIE